jgi:hypothetical protein
MLMLLVVVVVLADKSQRCSQQFLFGGGERVQGINNYLLQNPLLLKKRDRTRRIFKIPCSLVP